MFGTLVNLIFRSCQKATPSRELLNLQLTCFTGQKILVRVFYFLMWDFVQCNMACSVCNVAQQYIVK